jgi:hypothetical protein
VILAHINCSPFQALQLGGLLLHERRVLY